MSLPIKIYVIIGGFYYGPLGQETPVSQAPKMFSVGK